MNILTCMIIGMNGEKSSSVFICNICSILLAFFLTFFITTEKYYRFMKLFSKHLQYPQELNFAYLETRA